MLPARLLRASFTLGVLPVSIRRFPLFALSLFLALLLVPSRAFALDIIPKGVIYQGDVQGTNYGAVVSAYNQYDAACYVLGKDPNTISSTIKAKLSDSNYGGRFYEYAQSFFTQSGGLEDMPEWVPTYIFWGSEVMDLVLADYQAVWYSTSTKALHDAALVDFVRILNGEDVGGSVPSDSTFIGPYTSVGVSANQRRLGTVNNLTAYNATYVDGFLVVGSGSVTVSAFTTSSHYVSSGRVLLSSTAVDFINDKISSGYDVVIAINGSGSALIYGNNLSKPWNSNSGAYVVNGSNGHYVLFRNTPSGYLYNDDIGLFSVVGYNVDFNVLSLTLPNTFDYMSDVISSPLSTPTSPPAGVWPEPEIPSTPTAPDLPEPVEPTVTPDPVVTEPTPTWPDFNITVNPPAVIVPETPEGLDYTALLTLINDNLESIDSYTVAINSSLNSLRSDLVTEFDGVVQSLRNIYSYLQHMDSVLERHCVHLQNKMEDVSTDIQNKMRELVHWLAEQLDFDSESSGNSDLFGILSTISDKLGGGTYEPNPIRDELGYYEWLDNLWDRFLLGDNWQASAGSISQSFGQLTSRFPFSVPWDIVALFRLFVHDPVTPVFDLPLYYSADDYATVHVDLSGWDGVAAVVRPLVFVIFALNLALLSRHLLAGFGADKGGL